MLPSGIFESSVLAVYTQQTSSVFSNKSLQKKKYQHAATLLIM